MKYFIAFLTIILSVMIGGVLSVDAARYYDEPSGISGHRFHHYYQNDYDYYYTPRYTVTYPSNPVYFTPTYSYPYYYNNYTTDRTTYSCQREYGIGSIPNTSGGCKCGDDYQWDTSRNRCEPLRRSYQNGYSCTYRTYYGPSQWVESSYPCTDWYR
ncbi:MAG: hypothetical protein U0518_04670 [Candidatus Gracilibacteria bacterium]